MVAWTRTQVIEWMEEDLTYSVVVQSTRLKGGLGGVGGGSGQDNPRLHDLWQVYF